jgi:hypothetical protein
VNEAAPKRNRVRILAAVACLPLVFLIGWPYVGTGVKDQIYVLTAETEYEDWYPQDVTPPKGTQYPCALTALPRDLPGIPPSERGFINHTYSKLLEGVQLKLVMLQAVVDGGSGLDEALSTYKKGTDEVLAAIRKEEPPPGLRAFQSDVLSAIELQQRFFTDAVTARVGGESFNQVLKIPAGRKASALLFKSWRHMQDRYESWTPAMKDSMYHHLCALDLF